MEPTLVLLMKTAPAVLVFADSVEAAVWRTGTAVPILPVPEVRLTVGAPMVAVPEILPLPLAFRLIEFVAVGLAVTLMLPLEPAAVLMKISIAVSGLAKV